jgi:hypothetical protein
MHAGPTYQIQRLLIYVAQRRSFVGGQRMELLSPYEFAFSTVLIVYVGL